MLAVLTGFFFSSSIHAIVANINKNSPFAGLALLMANMGVFAGLFGYCLSYRIMLFSNGHLLAWLKTIMLSWFVAFCSVFCSILSINYLASGLLTEALVQALMAQDYTALALNLCTVIIISLISTFVTFACSAWASISSILTGILLFGLRYKLRRIWLMDEKT